MKSQESNAVKYPVVVTDNIGSVHMSGRNLAVILRYARKHPVTHVRIDHSVENIRGWYIVTFYFENGTHAVTRWADWRVLLDWLLSRRSWPAVERIRFADPGLCDAADSWPTTAKHRARGTYVVGPAATAKSIRPE